MAQTSADTVSAFMVKMMRKMMITFNTERQTCDWFFCSEQTAHTKMIKLVVNLLQNYLLFFFLCVCSFNHWRREIAALIYSYLTSSSLRKQGTENVSYTETTLSDLNHCIINYDQLRKCAVIYRCAGVTITLWQCNVPFIFCVYLHGNYVIQPLKVSETEWNNVLLQLQTVIQVQISHGELRARNFVYT